MQAPQSSRQGQQPQSVSPRMAGAAPKGGGKAAGRGKLGEAAAAEPEPEALVPVPAILKVAI